MVSTILSLLLGLWWLGPWALPLPCCMVGRRPTALPGRSCVAYWIGRSHRYTTHSISRATLELLKPSGPFLFGGRSKSRGGGRQGEIPANFPIMSGPDDASSGHDHSALEENPRASAGSDEGTNTLEGGKMYVQRNTTTDEAAAILGIPTITLPSALTQLCSRLTTTGSATCQELRHVGGEVATDPRLQSANTRVHVRDEAGGLAVIAGIASHVLASRLSLLWRS